MYVVDVKSYITSYNYLIKVICNKELLKGCWKKYKIRIVKCFFVPIYLCIFCYYFIKRIKETGFISYKFHPDNMTVFVSVILLKCSITIINFLYDNFNLVVIT